EVLKRAFGMTGEEIDRDFLQFVDEKLARVKVRPGLDGRTIRQLAGRIAKNANDLEALRSLAWGYAKHGRVIEAEGALEKLKKAAPDDADGFLVRAWVQLSPDRKRPDLAIENFKKGFAGGAEEFFARLRYAELLNVAKKFDEVEAQLRAAIRAF